MDSHWDAKDRVLAQIMTEIQHLPLPARRPRYGAAAGGFLVAYAAGLVLMLMFRGPVLALWQWLIGTLWVSVVEWAVTSRWSEVDMVMALAVVAAAAWMARTRGHTGG